MSKKRALVVEDNPLNQKLTSVLLEREGYEVRMAEDGMEALGLFETFRPDLILMDIQLPSIDGTEIVRLIRSDLVNSGVLIVALTAHRDEEWRRKALNAGCDAYLVKPVSIATLRQAVSQANVENTVRPETAVAAVDRVALMTRIGGDRELLRELQNAFLEECPRVNEESHRHLLARDHVALADAAHALKGMLETLSALGAKHAAQTLELSAASGDLTSAACALDDVGKQVDLFLKDLAEMVEAS